MKDKLAWAGESLNELEQTGFLQPVPPRTRPPRRLDDLQVGHPIPQLTGRPLNAQPETLTRNAEIALIAFIDLPTRRRTIPTTLVRKIRELEAFHQSYRQQGVRTSLLMKPSHRFAAEFIEKAKVSFQVIPDADINWSRFGLDEDDDFRLFVISAGRLLWEGVARRSNSEKTPR